jgi:hypothetical protein
MMKRAVSHLGSTSSTGGIILDLATCCAGGKDKSHAAALVFNQPIRLGTLVLIRPALLTREVSPSLLDGVIQALAVMRAKHLALHLAAIINRLASCGRDCHGIPPLHIHEAHLNTRENGITPSSTRRVISRCGYLH